MQFLLLVGKQPHPSHLNTKKQQRDNHKQHLHDVSNAVSQLLFMVVSLFSILLCFQFSLAHINILQQRAYLCLQVFNLHVALMQHVVLRDDEEGRN